MRKIEVRFETDPSLDRIEVLVRGPERDGEAEALMERIAGRPPAALTAAGEDGVLHRLAPEDVISVSVEKNNTQLVTEDGRYFLRQTLQSLETELDTRFVRISRYELVNLDKVIRYDFTVAGTLRLELTGGMETWASRRCIPAIRKRLMRKG